MSYTELSDEEWFSKIAGDNGAPQFNLPPESLQTSTVGRSGRPILRDAFMFWQFVRRMLIINGNGLSRRTQVADFGCAWGRIIRFWLRDLPATNLHGFDIEERFLSIAREHVVGPSYTLSQARPPLPAADNSFDVIYAFSVFSHLPQDVADAWINEFARVLKPGGIACLTTRPRAHIEVAGSAIDNTAHADTYAKVITQKDEALRRYDAGEFIFYPAHGGGGLSAETYGEAIIPPNYARENWGALELVKFAEHYSETYLQPCFVLRKAG
ncbi:class I SAM-dependent methyltransferase [Sphingobium sp. R-7]|uniref:class I SAM-dependent methyltransferase n=1 Tax=Sphingobium sp. R-7 TaxID=3375449 RepID=UPI00398AA2B9